MNVRQAEITRNTKETQIRVKVNLDGRGAARLATGLPFLEHMLDQIRHSAGSCRFSFHRHHDQAQPIT